MTQHSFDRVEVTADRQLLVDMDVLVLRSVRGTRALAHFQACHLSELGTSVSKERMK